MRIIGTGVGYRVRMEWRLEYAIPVELTLAYS